MKSADVVRPMVGPAWTLYYDVYFAIIFAICMAISHKYRGILVSAVCLVLVFLSGRFNTETPFLYIISQQWWYSFVLGICSFYIVRAYALHDCHLSPLYKVGVAGIGILNLVLLFIRPVDVRVHAFYAFIAFVAILVLLRNASVPNIVNTFGKTSYSFYLLHYYVIIVIGKLINLQYLSIQAIIGSMLVLSISCIAAYIAYYLFELKIGDLLKTMINKIGT